MANVKKTNAVRILENLKIPFELMEYEIDTELLSAEDASAKTGVPMEQTFKTICCRGDKTGVFFAVAPAGTTLNVKALAQASGNKSASPVHLKEVTSLTGYIRGGCSPIGAKKNYPVVLDETAVSFDFITVNAGARGLLFKMMPLDLVKVTNAKVAKITL